MLIHLLSDTSLHKQFRNYAISFIHSFVRSFASQTYLMPTKIARKREKTSSKKWMCTKREFRVNLRDLCTQRYLFEWIMKHASSSLVVIKEFCTLNTENRVHIAQNRIWLFYVGSGLMLFFNHTLSKGNCAPSQRRRVFSRIYGAFFFISLIFFSSL